MSNGNSNDNGNGNGNGLTLDAALKAIAEAGKKPSVRLIRDYMKVGQAKAMAIMASLDATATAAKAQAIVTELPPILAKALDEHLQGKLESLKEAYQSELDSAVARGKESADMVDALEEAAKKHESAMDAMNLELVKASARVDELRALADKQAEEIRQWISRASKAEGVLEGLRRSDSQQKPQQQEKTQQPKQAD